MVTRKAKGIRQPKASTCTAGEARLVSKKGKQLAVSTAPPAMAGTRPGDVLFGPLFGTASKPYICLDNFFFWTGSAWENSASFLELTAAESSDVARLAKVRRRFLKVYGYL